MDLGRQLLDSASEGLADKVYDLMCRGAPFTTFDWWGENALHMAAKNNHYTICEMLLEAGVGIDSKSKVSRTPLHLAVINGHEAIVQLLLERNCDVNARDMMKQTPLHWAVEEDYPNLVSLLLQHGADPDAKSKCGETPISIAQELKFDEIVEMLTSYKHQMNVSMEEQEEATDIIMHQMSTSKQQNSNSSTTELLQDDLSFDDTNAFPQSSCQKFAGPNQAQKSLKVRNASVTHTIKSNMMQTRDGDVKQRSVGIIEANASTPKLLKKSNFVKQITSEGVIKICGDGKDIKPVNVLTNSAIRSQKYQLMTKVSNNESTSHPVEVINKPKILNGLAGPATITTPAGKVEYKSLPQLTSFKNAKFNNANIGSSLATVSDPTDSEMVLLSKNEYDELVKLKNRCKQLEAYLAKKKVERLFSQ